MANFEPLSFRRKFGSNTDEKPQSSNQLLEESPFIDVSGATVIRAAVTGACRKCGYVGHLAYQCRNFLQLKDANPVLESSSTSSDTDYETPLVPKRKTKKSKEDKKKRKEKRKKKHKERDELKRSSRDENITRKNTKRKRGRSNEKERKRKKRKRHSSSTSS